jgi:hypothetical protein
LVIVVRNAIVTGQSLTWPDGAEAAKQAELLRELEIIIRTPFRGSMPQSWSLFNAFVSKVDFAERGSFQNPPHCWRSK